VVLLTRRREPPYALIVLLAAALMINYVDHGTTSTTATLLEGQFHLLLVAQIVASGPSTHGHALWGRG